MIIDGGIEENECLENESADYTEKSNNILHCIETHPRSMNEVKQEPKMKATRV